MARHQVSIENILQWLEEEKEEWNTYASSAEAGGSVKQLKIRRDGLKFKVVHNQVILYEGRDLSHAVCSYNGLP